MSAQSRSDLAGSFPAIGRQVVARFPDFQVELCFHSSSSLTWTKLHRDGGRGPSETEEIAIQPIADLVFVLSWQEANRTTVVSVQDYGKGLVHTHITRTDGTFIRASGRLVPVDASAG
jgi:hypothetical protein